MNRASLKVLLLAATLASSQSLRDLPRAHVNASALGEESPMILSDGSMRCVRCCSAAATRPR